MVRSMLLAVLWLPLTAAAAGGEVALDRANIDVRDAISIQHGAKIFVNYCLNCHSAAYMRYNRLTDLGLSEQQIRDNLMFATDKIGDTMTAAQNDAQSKEWFGVVPPDLSVIARSRSADWLYTYLRSFYRDASRPSGWNNLVFADAAMPNVLWEQQGMQRLEVTSKDFDGHKIEHRKLVIDTPGTLTPAEYDKLVQDLVNYLVFMSEPARTKRTQTGIVVLFFLGLLLVLAWLLKREYWKDVN